MSKQEKIADEEARHGNREAVEAMTARAESAEAENNKLIKVLELYERERERFRHYKPELTGKYFIGGGHGNVDSNMLPEYIRIVPAYGCAWEQVYVKTDKTISYEGS